MKAAAGQRLASLLGRVSPGVRCRLECPSRAAAAAAAAASARRGVVTAVTVYSGEQRPRWKSSFAPRHGKAVEPGGADAEAAAAVTEALLSVPLDAKQTTTTTPRGRSVVKMEDTEQGPVSSEAEAEAEEVVGEEAKGNGQEGEQGASSSQGTASAGAGGADAVDRTRRSGPLEAVLQMETPESVARQHPPMSPPRYVHHFDTFSLVKQLQEGGYTEAQAIEAMKGIRQLLAQHLGVAQDSLVSKSDVENETYLFRAACSELGQEIKNNRRLQDEQVRQQRTHLQHEVDILQQSLNQEVSTLNDNIRGMFNDRKMAVRAEETTAEGAIQQINYKISTSLVSDMKSEIEGVRWILIRRSATGIFFMAMVTLLAIRYATYLHSEKTKEKNRRRKEEKLRKERGLSDSSPPAEAAVILSAN